MFIGTKPKSHVEMSESSKNMFRTPIACNTCRRRKTKCTGERPSCNFCLKQNIQCLYPQSLLYGSYSYLPDQVQAQSPEANSSPPTNSPQSVSLPATTATNLQQPEDPAVPTLHLPPNPLLQRLLEIFFCVHHNAHFCSFLMRSSFELRNIHEQPSFLVTSIIALASLFLEDGEVQRYEPFTTNRQFSQSYVLKARQLSKDFSEKPSISSSQANLVLAFYELYNREVCNAWMYSGTAIRMAQALRLGREYSPNHSAREKETRRRTYWACVLIDRLLSYATARPQTLDQSNFGIQLPCPEASFVFDERYHGATLEDLISSPELNIASLQGVLPFYIGSIVLWGNMAKQYLKGRRGSKVVPSDPSSPFSLGLKQLRYFKTRLPVRLQWSEETYALHRSIGEDKAFVNMAFLLEHATCICHQEYLPQNDLPGFFAQDDVYLQTIYDKAGMLLEYRDEEVISTCVESAVSIVRMAKTMLAVDENSFHILPSPFIGGAFMTAAAVLIWVLFIPGELLRQNCDELIIRANVEFIFQTFHNWTSRWSIAVAWVDTLKMLSKLYTLAYDGEGRLDMITQNSMTPSNSSEPTSRHGGKTLGKDGVVGSPDADSIYQTMFDKVRNITMAPLEHLEEKTENLDVFLHSLWQHTFNTRAIAEPVGL